MQGIVAIWSGAIVDIPAGWVLCDGTNGTPDLRDRFVVGAGDTYNPDDNGGAITHRHSFTSDTHTHDFTAGAAIGAGTTFGLTVSSKAVTGNTSYDGLLPPYYALAYIIKTL